MKDYYQILGVERDASIDVIKKRFRQLARESHPDANPDDPTAEERFREIAEAYEVLSDTQKRARFDRGEEFGADLFSNFGGLDEILSQFFGGAGGFGFGRGGAPSRRGQDVVVAVDLELAEAAFGVSREISFVAPATCTVCDGSGAAEGYVPVSCPTCGGRGQVQATRNTFLGAMTTVAECHSCRGNGAIIEEKCPNCAGGGRLSQEIMLTVEIPPGVDDGTRLRLPGRGGAGEFGSAPGDLYVQVKLLPDARFERLGSDLHHRIRLGLAEAALGSIIRVPLIEGDDVDVDIPPGTQPGTVFRIARKGVPHLRRRGRGDLLVNVDVAVPDSLTPEQEGALRSYAELRGEQPLLPKRKRKRR
ncbi:molecular chaperone DnaJ [Actinomycetota bacterium]